MKDGLRRTFRIAGFALIAVAVAAIGYATWNLVAAETNTDSSLKEAEQILQDMESFTGSPEDYETDIGEVVLDEDGNVISEDGGNTVDAITDWLNGGTIQGGTEQTAAGNATKEPNKPAATRKPAATPNPNATPQPTATAKRSPYFGILVFNTLGNRKVPVLEGISVKNLDRGAVHHPRSSKAGGVGNCVIYGHRNTVFRSFGNLKVGDTIRLQVPGETLVYKVTDAIAVDKDDPRIFKAYGQKVMTLVTCYPFNYIGPAPRRYIVVCVLEETLAE